MGWKAELEGFKNDGLEIENHDIALELEHANYGKYRVRVMGRKEVCA